MMDTKLFLKDVNEFGEFRIQPLRIPEDIPIIHQWVNQDYAKFWGLLPSTREKVTSTYRDLVDSAHTKVFIGYHNELAAFLLEVYEPQFNPVGQEYPVEKGDLGMHILIAPPIQTLSNFTYTVFKLVMEFMLSDPAIKRIVVEPDHRNKKIHRLNKRVGFQHVRILQIGEKTAYLGFCTRSQFAEAMNLESRHAESRSSMVDQPELAASALNPKVWALVNRHLLSKCISELAHELLIQPELVESKLDSGLYLLKGHDNGIVYRFIAKRLLLDHWDIQKDSIQKFVHQQEKTLDAVQFITEFREVLGIKAEMLPVYLEEIISTLSSSAFKQGRLFVSAQELAQASFQEIEMAMTEGHPAFLANNGRIGFDAEDYRAYAPEVGAPVALIWLAAHRERTTFACVKDWSYESLVDQELDLSTRDLFQQKLRDLGLNPADYLFFPVHPWQWFNKIANVFAPELATHYLVCLGSGDDSYFAQQSIRTLFNGQHPQKSYVKTALSILNMGFMRGLSSYYMRTTPAINEWVQALVENDPFFNDKGFFILREIATIGYQNPTFENMGAEAGVYKKMLAALWRESPLPRLESGQRLMTMAALLHTDARGGALLPELIQTSPLGTSAWIKRYLDVYLAPILHCYFQYDLVFMPHGENLMLVLEDNVPVKAIMKDIGEEVCLLNSNVELPVGVERISATMNPDIAILSIFTDVFDGIFRYLSSILLEHMEFSEQDFWQLVAETIQAYEAGHPHLAAKFMEHDLFQSEFHRSCLNRLQLANNRQMIDLADPAKNLQLIGKLKNPIASFREVYTNSRPTLAQSPQYTQATS